MFKAVLFRSKDCKKLFLVLGVNLNYSNFFIHEAD